MLLMGLDVGTTGVKACVFDEAGTQLGYGFEEVLVTYPAPGRAEQDAQAVFEALKRVMRQAAHGCGGDIRAIGLSVQGDAVVPLGEDRAPLCPVHLGMDYRCAQDADDFEARFSALALFEKTGMRPHPMNSLCKIRYFTKNMPKVAARARHYVTYADYVLMKLGADELVIDFSMATRTMGMDLCKPDWDDGLLGFAGISRDMLPRPVASGVAVGRLSGALASETGISPGALLVTGGHDQTCAALGAGLVQPNLALDSHGTAEVISSALAELRTNRDMFEGHFPCYAHVVPGMYFTFSLNHTAGILLRWFVEGFCEADIQRAAQAGVSPYGYVLGAAGHEPSSLIALPYFNGKGTPDCDIGVKGMLLGLTLSTTRNDVARAIVEALCFDMRENIEALGKAGIHIDSLRCVGGGARSELGLRLKADITGLPLDTLAVREAACLGAAMLAGVACGAFKDARQAAGIVRLGNAYAPDTRMRARYDERYELYREAYRRNKDLLRKV